MTAKLLAPAFALALAALAAGAALAHEGSVQGTNTVDYVNSNASAGDQVSFTVSATGAGTNKLRVEVQLYQWETGSWLVLREMYVSPGTTSTGSFTVPNDPDHTEIVRYRLGRKIGTQRIDYTLTEQ